jgi:peroxiredoxin
MARENEVLSLGDKAPEFTLPDVLTGQTVALADLLGKPVLLYFARGTWCPTCRRWMDQMAKRLPDLQKRGVHVIAVVPQKADSAAAALRDEPYPFPVLSDASRAVVKQYGVYVRANFESINIARPSTFVLDAAGAVRFMQVASIQFEFASWDDVFSTIDSL